MREYLRALAMAHYIVGGIRAMNSCFPLIYCAMGVLMMLQPDAFFSHGSGPRPPSWIGLAVVIVTGSITLIGWALSWLTIQSGRNLARQKGRVFSIVVAAVNCIFFPFGTALGIITIVMLCKAEAVTLYMNNGAPPATLPPRPPSPPSDSASSFSP